MGLKSDSQKIKKSEFENTQILGIVGVGVGDFLQENKLYSDRKTILLEIFDKFIVCRG